ncbi:MAG TPA: hypothetical protein VN611_16590 [Patescibacteria group bacterium]|nr:hypothetical protein [Patescibacteria group bacterium]
MSVAVVDVREWQNTLDLKSGRKISDDRATVNMLKGVLKHHPFPGDTDPGSNAWVTDTALELAEKYDPRFVFLTYSQQYFSSRFLPMPEAERQTMIDNVFAEIDRFVQVSGFNPVIIGSGDMVAVAGRIDLSRLDGLAVSSHWSTHYAGLYNASERDLEYIKKLDTIERLVDRTEFIRQFDGKSGDEQRLPEHLVVAREGYCFKTPALRRPCMIPAGNYCIPLSLPSGTAKTVTDIGAAVLEQLRQRPTALIMVEGVGMKDFRLEFTPCQNSVDWFFYEPGEAQFLAVSQGRHQMFDYCPGYRDYLEDSDEYPFSGYFNAIPEQTIGKRFAGKSIAVGNRSMFIHTLTGADIAIECFARNLNNQGCMGVVHPSAMMD